MRHLALLLPFLVLGGCDSGELSIQLTGERTLDDQHALTVVLEGEGLQSELAASPERASPSPFIRLGVQWEAAGGSVIELSTSADGQTWSEWQPVTVHHLETEEHSAYIGELVLGAEAHHYRVRASGETQPSFLAMEFIGHLLAGGLEDGEVEPDVGDELVEEMGTVGMELSVGAATVNARSAWGAKAAKCSSNHSPYRITVHHTVTPTVDSLSPQARLRQIQAYHQNVQGWCDIGYHYLVSRDGRLWEGRPAGKLGTHVGNNNTGNVGISFMGTHTSTSATATQVTNVAKLMKGLGSRYGIPVNSTRIKGHRNYGLTACPGDALYRQLPTLITKAQGSTTVTPPPPTSTGTVVKGLVYVGGNTSKGLSGAAVKLGTRTATSDANGYWVINSVPAGTYTLTVSRSGYQTLTQSKSISGKEQWASTGLTAVVPTMVVKGLIYQGTNTSKPIAGATVKLGTRTTTTDSAGMYQFGSVASGTYTITASKTGFKTISITKAVTANPTWGSIGLPSALATGTASLTGVIYRGTNTANRVGGATVTLSDGRKTTADANGVYNFTKLPAVTTVITATKVGVGTNKISRTLQSNTLTWGSISL